MVGQLLAYFGINWLEKLDTILNILVVLFWFLFFYFFVQCPLKIIKPKSFIKKVLIGLIGCCVLIPFIQLEQVEKFDVKDVEKYHKEKNVFHLMTFNLRDSRIDKTINTWQMRLNPIIDTILDTKPDVIGTQEGQNHMINDIMEGRLDQHGYDWFGEITMNDTRDTAIIYNKNRVQLLEQSTFWLSDTPQIPQSKFSYSALGRSCSYGKFKFISTGREFYFFNTHFDHISEAARKGQAQVVIDKIHQIKEDVPIFLTGDFNSPTFSPVYQLVQENGFQNIRFVDETKTRQKTQFFTFHAYLGSFMEIPQVTIPFKICFTIFYYTPLKNILPVLPFPNNFQLDFLFQAGNVNEINFRETFVLTHNYNGQFPSDHYPLSAFYDF